VCQDWIGNFQNPDVAALLVAQINADAFLQSGIPYLPFYTPNKFRKK
jgi:hypothetical protein